MISTLCLLFCSFALISGCQERPIFEDVGPYVNTLSGAVVGKNIKVLDKEIATFFGIPFAIPPLGERRFKKPEPVQPWKGMIIANEKSTPCMQYSVQRNITVASYGWLLGATPSEDCLYLNIWSPTKCRDEKLPVLVWIYGGGFSSGSSDMEMYNATILSAVGHVVVVTFNYRVGSFGFIATGSDEAPGNAGMYDQVLAMEWVKDNIEAFGGDPDSITLFGESAGAISISLHLISPLSRGLFHRAILQSGSAYGSPIIEDKDKARSKAKMFAELAGCANEKDDVASDDVLSCLKSKEALDLSKLEAELTTKFPTLFAPTYTDEFLPKSPKRAYRAKDVTQVEIMTGLMMDEASIFLHYILPDYFPYDRSPDLNLDRAWQAFKQLYKLAPRVFISLLWYTYVGGVPDNDSRAIVNAVRNSFGDSVFNCPTKFLAETFDTAYVYWMTHRSSKNPTPEWVGATHFDDVPYVFGQPFADKEHFDSEDVEFSRDVINKWVTFARTGHPMGESKDLWPKFSDQEKTYVLNPRNSTVVKFPRDHCGFWRTASYFTPF